MVNSVTIFFQRNLTDSQHFVIKFIEWHTGDSIENDLRCRRSSFMNGVVMLKQEGKKISVLHSYDG